MNEKFWRVEWAGGRLEDVTQFDKPHNNIRAWSLKRDDWGWFWPEWHTWPHNMNVPGFVSACGVSRVRDGS